MHCWCGCMSLPPRCCMHFLFVFLCFFRNRFFDRSFLLGNQWNYSLHLLSHEGGKLPQTATRQTHPKSKHLAVHIFLAYLACCNMPCIEHGAECSRNMFANTRFLDWGAERTAPSTSRTNIIIVRQPKHLKGTKTDIEGVDLKRALKLLNRPKESMRHVP